ncbi:acyltransferase [Spirosoma sp. SC4-14]|uniref:acyltransferase family protein n=1 Tax=Spirosoma sp. SC4-14 TaxID=3128900 RepID=UPI0030D4D1B5
MTHTTNSPFTSSPIHIRFLDGLRALAALYVVVHHQQQPLPSGQRPMFDQVMYRLFFHGHYAVDLFIVISGFCLMMPVLRNNLHLASNSPLRFFQKRAQRILPPYFLAMGLSLLLIATLIGQKTGTRWDASIPVTPFDLVTHALMLHDVFMSTASKINGVFWSIAVEWRIYLFFPLLLFCWRRWGSVPATLTTILFGYAIWHFLSVMRFPAINLTQWGLCPHYLGLFGIGMFAAHLAYSNRIGSDRLDKLPWATLLIGLGAVIILVTRFDTLLPWVYVDLLVGISAGLLLVALGIGKLSRLNALFSWQPLVAMGTFSYSIYLIHMPLIQLIQQYLIFPLHLNRTGTTLYLFLIGTALIVCCSYVFYLLAERPFVPKKIARPQVGTITVS